MAVSLNSVMNFNSTGYYNSVHHDTSQVGGRKIRGKKLGVKNGSSMASVQDTKKEGATFLAVCRGKVSNQQVTRANIKVFSPKVPWITSRSVGLRHSTQEKKPRFHLVAAPGDNVATETSDKSESIQESNSNNEPSDTVNPPTTDEKIQSNGAVEESAPKSSSGVKRASLTARERLRAARVLSRYNETKSSKPELGNKLLEALQESDKKGKKRSGLPQAPTDLFDDSKRGMPKEGWTFELPGGLDVFLIAFSFVFISSVMFATTYLVWKVGAIHFNEY